MPSEDFEILSEIELSTHESKRRGPYKKSSARIVEDFEVLDENQVSELVDFELVSPDFDYSSLPKEYTHSRTERKKSQNANRPIVFIDGEGANVGDRTVGTRKQKLRRWIQKQNYALLGATIEPDEYRCIVGQNNTEQLSTKQCFEFILSLPSDHILIGFALTYDVEMWIKGISGIRFSPDKPSSMERLIRTQSLWWKGYRIHYIPNKIFTLGKYKGNQKIASRTIYDSFGFFQSDFKSAIRNWKVGTPEQWEFIDRMKDARGDFGPITEETKAYNKMEGVHGIEMFSKVRAEYKKLELNVPRPVGAGSIASAMFRKHEVLQYYPTRNLIPIETQLSALYGGRFDCTKLGFFDAVIESDINSAYPHIARNLPCLRCNTYVNAKEYTPSPYSLWLVRWKDNGTRWSPFPYRTTNGHIGYFADGIGWYYDSEVAAALRFDPNIEVLGGYSFEQNCEHRPFAFLEEYYHRRQELLLQGDFAEKILKLGCNSVYGKLAQSKGKNPPFQQIMWAGMITGGTRAMLLDGIRQAPESVIKVATDALFSTVPLQLEYHETNLGGWKTEELYDFLVLGNGIYQSLGSSSPKHPNGIARNRGFARERLRFDWQQIRENYRNGKPSVVSKYEFRRFIKALHENKLEERCDWIESEIELKVDVQKKKRLEGEFIYPIANPTPAQISSPIPIKPENLRIVGSTDSLT